MSTVGWIICIYGLVMFVALRLYGGHLAHDRPKKDGKPNWDEGIFTALFPALCWPILLLFLLPVGVGAERRNGGLDDDGKLKGRLGSR